MIVIAIDPGPEQSAVVELNHDASVSTALITDNDTVLQMLAVAWPQHPAMMLVIEEIESMGMPVGREVFRTVFWSGRFVQVWANRFQPWQQVTRRTVKLHHCGTSRGTDATIRQALLDRYGGKARAIGTKKAQGPLYSVKSHLWSALALGLTYADVAGLSVPFP